MFSELALVLAVVGVQSAGAPAADLIGTWEVAHVGVNMADQPHWNYRPEDPQLVGRELVVSSDQIRFADFNGTRCAPATWKRESWSWKDLTDEVFLGPKSSATPAEWKLKTVPRGKVTVHVPCGHSPSWTKRSWLVAIAPDKVIFELDPETVLFLARRRDDAKPKPSFSCAKASSATEKAICGSFVLAGWDRSVALAWQHAIEVGKNDSMDDQKAWLHTRDKCGSDAACLERVMRDRTTELFRH